MALIVVARRFLPGINWLRFMTPNPSDIPLRCRCGHVRGVANDVAPDTGFRFVCYCGDCQAFARFLGRPDVLDTAGGTDIFQMPTGRVKLTAGTDAVRCLHLSGKVFRWYTDCCQTPIGNTAGPRFRLSASFIRSWTTMPAVVPGTRRSARRFAGSSSVPLSDRSRRTRLRRSRSASSPFAYRSFSAGGCAGSAGRTHSSTCIRTLHSPCRASSRRVKAPPPASDPLRRDLDRFTSRSRPAAWWKWEHRSRSRA
jgi:hypothetical protein